MRTTSLFGTSTDTAGRTRPNFTLVAIALLNAPERAYPAYLERETLAFPHDHVEKRREQRATFRAFLDRKYPRPDAHAAPNERRYR